MQGITHGMAVYILGHRMDNNIRPVVQGVLYIRAEEGIVNHNHDPMLMRNRGDSSYIDQAEGGIARAFNPY
jgi:hypothetical protein